MILAALLLYQAFDARAEDAMDPEKVAAIKELLAITGAGIGREEWTRTFSQQMVSVLKANNIAVNERTERLIASEVDLMVAEQLDQELLQRKMYRIYARYFTLAEIHDLIAFNRSPIGAKANRVMPVLMRESMSAAQQWSIEIGPEMSTRVLKRLESEGISLGR